MTAEREIFMFSFSLQVSIEVELRNAGQKLLPSPTPQETSSRFFKLSVFNFYGPTGHDSAVWKRLRIDFSELLRPAFMWKLRWSVSTGLGEAEAF